MYYHTATYLLSNYFLLNIKQLETDNSGRIKVPNEYKFTIIKQCEQLLRHGLSYENIKETLTAKGSLKKFGPLDCFDEKYKNEPRVVKKDKDELIQWGIYYMHPLLQDSSGNPKYIYDEDKSEHISVSDDEPYFLEMVDSFTITDLTNYFTTEMYDKEIRDVDIDTAGLYKKQFRRLAARYDLNHLLYMIDEYRYAVAEDDFSLTYHYPNGILNKVSEANESLESRKSILREEGLLYVRPRQSIFGKQDPINTSNN